MLALVEVARVVLPVLLGILEALEENQNVSFDIVSAPLSDWDQRKATVIGAGRALTAGSWMRVAWRRERMRVVAPYLAAWPDVDLDLRSAFRFGGIAALLGHEIDLLITPDPLALPGIAYAAVFDYQLVLAVAQDHPLAGRDHVEPGDLVHEVLITYPVEPTRLDIFTRFLVPGNCLPRQHRSVETTEMMLQLVAAGRGVSAVPDWFLREEGAGLPVRGLRIGAGLEKSINLGTRRGEEATGYIAGFLDLARRAGPRPQPPLE